MSRTDVDVAIVGAGPGGLYAAIEALKHGLQVHIFDKKKIIGIPVRCGEYFPVRKEMEYLLPNAGEYRTVFDVPEEAIDNVCKTIRVISPRGEEYEFEFLSYVLDRTVLEQGLAKQVEKMGGTIELQCPAGLFRDGGDLRVGQTKRTSIRSKVVIAADGFPSEIAKASGILTEEYVTPNNVAINYEYLITDLDIDQTVTEMYFGTKFAPGGYGWIIPKGNRSANVGIGIRTSYSKKNDGRGYLQYFMYDCHNTCDKLEGGIPGPMIADVLPVDGPLKRTYSDSVMAVGDAAAMVMPTNGGGIATAMITGAIAGQVAADHLQNNKPLSDYELRWKQVMGREMVTSTKMRRLADRVMGHDLLFDLMLRILNARGIKDVITCRAPRGLGPLIS
jgi:digeranylgeranylglycerophospholipid reductase